MSWLILISENGLILLNSFTSLFMKIDKRFEEALGVGPRFIMKGVYAHFGLTGCVNRNKFAHCKKAQEKVVCVHGFLRERPLESH